MSFEEAGVVDEAARTQPDMPGGQPGTVGVERRTMDEGLSRMAPGATGGRLGERLPRRGLARDSDGAYQVEYVVVLILVGLVGAIAIAGLGSLLVTYHHSVQDVILSPVP